jgi:thymidine phosphorylase
MTGMERLRHDELTPRRLGIDTYREPVVFMRADCAVCRSEGFRALSRVHLACGSRSVIATLNVIHGDLIAGHEAGLSESAWKALDPAPGAAIRASHPEMVESFGAVRSKIYGTPFTQTQLEAVIGDISAGRYSAIETASFVTACAGDNMSLEETLALTHAMVGAGTRLQWSQRPVLDKHCVGGLPGNRTTPIVVAIAAACGVTIPKTSSRAITSPAGTADTMEMLAPVDLTLGEMRRVVDAEGGCVVWGGAMSLSPADDLLIQVEKPLDFDSDGQLAASIISKKVAAGATHLLLDVPVGPTAKIRSHAAARALSTRLAQVATAFGLKLDVAFTDGTAPVGHGIGPALEAHDVLAVLRNDPAAPRDLRERALLLAGRLLELGGCAARSEGPHLAQETLTSGRALRKFTAICNAQGGMRSPPRAPHRHEFPSTAAGVVTGIDNRRLARLAKLAGAPAAPAAGVELLSRPNQSVALGQPLYAIHAESAGELEYALGYAERHPFIIQVGEPS